MVAKHLAGRTEELKEACMNTRRCLGKHIESHLKNCGRILFLFSYTGFNTNGILKSSLQWSSRWIRWTDYPLHGLHVLGM